MAKRSSTPQTADSPARPPQPARLGARPRVAIAVSRYNWTVTGKLLDGARASFKAATGSELADQDVYFAPGAFELVAICHAAADSRLYDGVVALGCVIKGETIHDQVLAHAVTQALANIPLVTGVPATLGVLTVNNAKQAKERSGGKLGNKGAEAMDALLATLAETQRIAARRTPRSAPSFEIDLSTLASPDKLVAEKGER